MNPLIHPNKAKIRVKYGHPGARMAEGNYPTWRLVLTGKNANKSNGLT
jgi:hypothetical protein